jgi:hypothetical protein
LADVRHLAPLARPLEQIGAIGIASPESHLADWREPTRNTNDRVLPGDGVIEFGPILEALRWNGLFDLEIFSDAELAGSLWRKEPTDLAWKALKSSDPSLPPNRLAKQNRSKFYFCRAGHTRGGAVKRTTRWGGLAVLVGVAVCVRCDRGNDGRPRRHGCKETDRDRVGL